MTSYDYIIVGAGSAGCVLAERLSASGRHSVLVLEAGGRGRTPWIALPLGYGKTFYDPSVNWKYETAPDAELNGRRDYWPRGKGVGGSGAINAMVYVRGLARDFDDWAAAGADGWDWANVRCAFDALETHTDADGTQTGTGPLHVQDVSDQIHPVTRHFFAAAEELDLPTTRDINGPEPEGVTAYRINTMGGRRMHSARAHLTPALRRANVTLMTDTLVTRIVFDTRCATGVMVAHKGQHQQITARREVILSAGAVSSPRLLQLSGIGPGALLRSHGIEVRHDTEHVGGNLQDHLGMDYLFRATEPTLNSVLRPWHGKLRAAFQYARTRRGPLSMSVNQCGGFVRSGPDMSAPDIQLYFNPVTYTTTPKGRRTVIQPDPFPGFIIGFNPTRPHSRGRIDISGPDPASEPLIQPNSLSDPRDHAQVIAAGRMCQRFMQTQALKGLANGPIGPDLLQMDEHDLLTDFRARASTVFHPVGTCRMGRDPATSVVCAKLKLHGFAGLRVVDASVFPNLTSGNTNAPTMMLAHKAADLIEQET